MMDAKDIIRRHGRAIAQVSISGGDFPEAMPARVLKNTDARLVLAFANGENSFVLKQFNADSITGAQAFLRERDGLDLFRESGLVSEITHFSDKDLFIITSFVDGPSVLDCIDESNCATLCLAMGQWYADYYRFAPSVEADGKWRSYLNKLSRPPHVDSRSIDAFLDTMPLKHTTWSRGDGALSNFLIREDGSLCGIDFEKSRWHPYGWDVLLTARAAARRVPGKSQACIAALVEGFCDGKREAMRRWLALTSVFVASYLFADEKASDVAPDVLDAPSSARADRRLSGAA